jgi:hypothetical protein
MSSSSKDPEAATQVEHASASESQRSVEEKKLAVWEEALLARVSLCNWAFESR